MPRTSQSTQLTQLETQPVGRLLWRYSLPAVVGMLVQALYHVVDRIFIGQWAGTDAFAGMTVTFPLMNLATAIGVLVGVGACSRVSILLGSGQHRSAADILGNATTLTILNGLAYLLLFIVFLDPLLLAFGATATTLPYAREYMLVLMPGLLLTNVAFSLNNVMRASGYPGRAMATMIIGGVVNVGLDPIFIKVLGMGITGAAIATDIAMMVSAIFVLWHFMQPRSTVRFERGTFGLRWHNVWAIISIGAAPALVNAAACVINAFVNRSLIKFSATPDLSIAAAGIFLTFASLSTTVVLGICQGMQPIVGYNYGAGHISRLKHTYWLAVGWASVFTVVASVVSQLWPQFIGMAFSSDEALVSATDNTLRSAMWAFSVVGFQIISTTFFQSISKAGKSVFLSLTRQVIFLLPLLWILSSAIGTQGVWLSFPVSDLFATVVTALMIFYQMRHLRQEATPAPAA